MKEVTMSATEANRSFSKALRFVREGGRVRVTSHGRTVAIISPPDADAEERRERRRVALARLEERWADQEPIFVQPWKREDLYDRDLR